MAVQADQPRIRESVFKLPITTREALRLYVERAHGVSIPDTKVCDKHSTPWDAFCDAYFATSPVVIWKASRGLGGKTFLLSLLTAVEASTYAAEINLLGGSFVQSQRVHEAMEWLWAHPSAPVHLLAGAPTKEETRFHNGARIRALTASQKSVRGPHPQRLRLDEIDEMDLSILDAALGQPMSRGGISAQTVMSSTHQYPSGTMAAMLQRAEENGWPVHEWCYHETAQPHGWLDPLEIAHKKQTVGSEMWEVEYELQKPRGAGKVFPTFAESLHVSDSIVYDEHLEVELGWDFGFRTTAIQVNQVDKYGTMRTIADYHFGGAGIEGVTTDQACKLFRDACPYADSVSLICCDPAGNAKNLHSGLTDVSKLRDWFPNARISFSTRDDHRNPEWRAARLRDLLLTADGEVHWFISPRAKHTIAFLDGLQFKRTNPSLGPSDQVAKEGVLEHMFDAAGYFVVNRFHLESPRIMSRRPF